MSDHICGAEPDLGWCPVCDGEGSTDEYVCQLCFGWGEQRPPKGCGEAECTFPDCGPKNEWSCKGIKGVNFWSGLPEPEIVEVPF